jgi:hypothetical protein
VRRHAPESLPAKAIGSTLPPSLLSIRIHAEKESPPGAPTDWPLSGHTELKNIFAALSSTYKIHIAKTIDRACYSEIR